MYKELCVVLIRSLGELNFGQEATVSTTDVG